MKHYLLFLLFFLILCGCGFLGVYGLNNETLKENAHKKSDIVFSTNMAYHKVESKVFEYVDKNGKVHLILVTAGRSGSGSSISTLELTQ